MIDPFVVAKLDIDTIRCFKFPEMLKNINKYTVRGYNKAGGESIVKAEEEALFGIAKASQADNKPTMNELMTA